VGKLLSEKKILPNVSTRNNKFPHLLPYAIFHTSRQNTIKSIGKHILGFGWYASKVNCQAVSAGNWAGHSNHFSQIIECRGFQ